MGNIIRLANVIKEEEVSLTRLQSLIEVAAIDVQVDEDEDLYATDDLEFPVWITMMNDKKLVMFYTFCEPRNLDCKDWYKEMNELNQEIIAAQFHWAEDAIWGHYFISYDGGLNARQFIKMLRRFSGAFRAGIASLGENVKNVGKCEPEELAGTESLPLAGEKSNVVLHPRARNPVLPARRSKLHVITMWINATWHWMTNLKGGSEPIVMNFLEASERRRG